LGGKMRGKLEERIKGKFGRKKLSRELMK